MNIEPEHTIVLYSKYSSYCKDFLSIVKNQSETDTYYTNGMKFVCVDNQKFRKKLLENKKLNITYIPCVLLIYANKQIEKFEGNGIADWIYQNLTPQNLNQFQNQPQPQPQVQPQNQNYSVRDEQASFQSYKQQQILQQPENSTNLDQLYDDEDDETNDYNEDTNLFNRSKNVKEIAAELASSRDSTEKAIFDNKQRIDSLSMSRV